MSVQVFRLICLFGVLYLDIMVLSMRKLTNGMRFRMKLVRVQSINTDNGVDLVKIGQFEIRSVEKSVLNPSQELKTDNIITMQDIASGWGNGKHPTTRLCLEYILRSVKPGAAVLDYGTGSGILSILSKKLGAKSCVAVDIDEDSLRAAETNARLNGYSVPEDIDVVHTKHVYIGESRFPLADVTVANILPGPLSRLVAPLWGLSKPGGALCLSGLRPAELRAIRSIYAPFVQLDTESISELSHETYGPWVSWVVRFKVMGDEERREARDRLSSLAQE